MLSALTFFGDADTLFATISRRVYEARISSGMVPEELAELTHLKNPLQIVELETKQLDPKQFSVADLMAIATQLGLNIERLIPFRREPNEAEMKQWETERVKEGAGPVVSADGGHVVDPNMTIRLFIRFKALEEVFGRDSDLKVSAV